MPRGTFPPLADWVNHELNGYPFDTNLQYRGPFPVRVVGDLSGPGGSGVKNIGIPPGAFQEQYQSGELFTADFRTSVAELEELVAANEQVLYSPWPANTVAIIDSLLTPGVHLGNGFQSVISVKQQISRGMLVAVLSSIRDRILDLALELEKIHPDIAGPAEPTTRVQQIQTVIAIVHGNAAIGSSDFEQLVQLQVPQTRDELHEQLRKLGVSGDELNELDEAIDEDAKASGKPSVGAKVGGWLKKHAEKGTTAAAGALGTAGGQAVVQLVQGFLTAGGGG